MWRVLAFALLRCALCRVRPAEVAALMQLYDETNGANWTNNFNWGTGDPCRKHRKQKPHAYTSSAPVALMDEYFEPTPWRGIGCLDPCDDILDGEACTAGRILSIDMRANNMNGSLSGWTRLGEMRNLTWIDFSFNELGGQLPTEIGRINELEVLSLRNNVLEGTLPSELGAVNAGGGGQLREFTFAFNRLSGTVPSELGVHAELMLMEVHNNSLSGSLPAQLSRFSALQVFHVQHNSFSGTLPAGMGGAMPGLRLLGLHNNAISGQIPSQIGSLTADLFTLDMSHNRLGGTLPSELGQLSQRLRFLKLSDNEIGGPIPSEVGQMMGLEELDLYNNRLTGDMPSELARLHNIRVLYLQNEQLLPLRLRYCGQRMPNLGKYSYRLVREEYHRMVNSICPEPLDTLNAFSSLNQLSGDV